MNTVPIVNAPNDNMQWGDNFLLGYAPMDSIHKEFVELLGFLMQASEEEIPALMHMLSSHAQEHFAAENTWMVETQFPARQCHMDEHAAVLKSINDVLLLVAEQHYGNVPLLAQALADWFPGHADYLDSALAHWMCKRNLGGKPVVLRRNIPLR